MNASPGSPVLVAVESPDHLQQLVRTAGDLARLGDGTVRLITVAAKPYDSPFGVFADETIVSEFAGDRRTLLEQAETPEGVTVEREVVVGRSVAKGLLRTVAETGASALVIGWEGERRHSDTVLGSTVDVLVERAPCDLYVERVGREADGVDSVLLPVAGGPHVRAAATAATAIADRNDATVVVLSVDTPGTGRDAAAAVAEGRASLDALDVALPAVETVVRTAGDVTDAVVEATADHDVVVLGATRKRALRRRLVGSVPRRVVGRTDATVILARDGDAVGGLLARLGNLLGS